MKLEKRKTITDDSATHELVYVGKRVYIKDGDVYYSTKQVKNRNKDGSTTFNYTWNDEKPIKLEDIKK